MLSQFLPLGDLTIMRTRFLSHLAWPLMAISFAFTNNALAERSGEQVVNTFCVACHISGVAGAPRIGNKADWQPREDKDLTELLASVTNGLNAMPAKGLCANCTEQELENAVRYMQEKASQ